MRVTSRCPGVRPPQLVARRNARERRRVQAVNYAFTRLRRAVPLDVARGKRVSKVRTLQHAIEYISGLLNLLHYHSPQHQPWVTPQTLLEECLSDEYRVCVQQTLQYGYQQ